VSLGYEPGQNEENGQKDDRPDQNGFALEKFNILIIRPFDIHASDLRFFSPRWTIDDLVKSPNSMEIVIPAKAGIQGFP
jgi:hypothetical protein